MRPEHFHSGNLALAPSKQQRFRARFNEAGAFSLR